jgi:hypothetical protein
MSEQQSAISSERALAVLSEMGVDDVRIDDDGDLTFRADFPGSRCPIVITVAPQLPFLRFSAGLQTNYDVEQLPRLHSAIVMLQNMTPSAKGLTFVQEADGWDKAFVAAVMLLPVRVGASDEQLTDWISFGVHEVAQFAALVDAEVGTVKVEGKIPTVEELEAWLEG